MPYLAAAGLDPQSYAMPALSDQTFGPKAYARMAVVALALLAVLASLVAIYFLYQKSVEDPRMLRGRFDDPPGQAGMSTVRVAAMGERAVPTLIGDLDSHSGERRSKAMEMLGGIDDPRVIPALAGQMARGELSGQLAAMAALARTGKPEAAAHIWPLTENRNEIVRYRAWIAIGLCGGDQDQKRLIELGKTLGDTDLYVVAWAVGHLQRRTESIAAGHKGYVRPAPDPGDEADIARVQAGVDEALQQIDKGADLVAAGKQLAELTDCDFQRSDIGHQIALQLIAIGGPRQFRGAGQQDAPIGPSRKPAVQLRAPVQAVP